MQMLSKDLRCQFPAFAARPGAVFFDNAATTQKPASVINSVVRFYESECVNPGRGVSALSTKARIAIESTREKVAKLLTADARDVAFTYGATDSLNIVAQSWGLTNLDDGDEIMLCLDDHRSATLPWLGVVDTLKRFGKEIRVVPFNIHEVGDYDLKSIKAAVSPKTKLLAMTHIHHVYGLEMEVSEIREIVGNNVAISLDASQSIGHAEVNVEKLPVDFISFSGHKMFAPNGSGVLWINPRRQSEMAPYRVGGGTAMSEASALCEAGTYNAPAIIGLGAAIDFINSVGLEAIEAHVSDLTLYLHDQLREIPGIEFAPGVGVCGCRHGYGVLSFRFQQAEAQDIAFMLDSENIMVRAGNLCQSKEERADAFIRVSMHVYNSHADVDKLISVLREQL